MANNVCGGRAFRIAIGITVLGLLLAGGAEAFLDPGALSDYQMQGRLEANGTHFELNNSEYLNITLDSSEPVNLTLESVPEMVTMHIESASGAALTQITLSGFLPLTTYHKYEDDYHNHVAFTTDASGGYTYTQDLLKPHLVFIQPKASTKFINDNATGGDCTSIGIWDASAKTCTLTTDLTETVQIDSDGIIFDGGGHNIIGSYTGINGVYIFVKNGVTIKNLNVKNFGNGIYLYNSNNNNIKDNDASNNNFNGISIRYGSSNNGLKGNSVSNNHFNGIDIWYGSSNNDLESNSASNNSNGIDIRYGSSNNGLKGNSVSNNYFNGIGIWDSDNNDLESNSASNNRYNGIDLRNSRGNTLNGNNALNNNFGIYMRDSSNNTLSGSNASNNEVGIALYSSSNNTLYRHNVINNTNQAYDDTGTNSWDNGYPSGGNYWSDYTGTDNFKGANQDQPGSDGIGDTSYPILGGSSVDRYPLMAPYTSEPPTPPIGKRIGIQAGHWQYDSGAIGCDGTTREVDINLAVANKAADLLRQRGYEVDILPSVNAPNSPVPGYAADAFVALHADYCAEGNTGFKVARYGGSKVNQGKKGNGDASDRLVDSLYSAYSTATGLPQDTNHITDNMIYYNALGRIASSTPGAIIEMGWLSGDLAFMTSEDGQQKMAAGIANAVDQFLGLPTTPAITSPVITSPLHITESGDTMNADFTIKNEGNMPVTFKVLTVGGRLNGGCLKEGCPDFTHQSLTLQPTESYQYEGSLTPIQSGAYHFFVTYQTPDENWNTNIDVVIDGELIRDYDVARRYREADMTISDEIIIKPALGPASWEPIGGPWDSWPKDNNIQSIAINPNNPNEIYVAATHRTDNWWEYQGGKLYKSTDGGANWNEISNGLPRLNSLPLMGQNPYYWPINAIAIAKSDPRIIYAGTTDFDPHNVDLLNGPHFSKGIYKSFDSGSTWIETNGIEDRNFPEDFSVSSIKVDPTNANIVYVGTIGNGVWRTLDGGYSWEQFFNPIGEAVYDVNIIAISPANPSIIYASAYNYIPYKGPIPNGIVYQGGLYKYEDGEWRKIFGNRVDNIAIDSKDANNLYIVTTGYHVYKSSDGGNNLNDISGAGGEDALPSAYTYTDTPFSKPRYSLAINPDSSSQIFTASLWDRETFGVYFSPNNGENWFPIGLQDENVEKLIFGSDLDSRILYAVTLNSRKNNVHLFKYDISNSVIVLKKYSPIEIRIFDSEGKVTGSINGEGKAEIPKSVYYNGVITIFSPIETYRYEVVGMDKGTYGLKLISDEGGKYTEFNALSIPTSIKAIHQYTVDWNALSNGEKGVTLQIDSEGDGVFERTINAGSTLTDITPPQITINVPANGGEYILNQNTLADWSAIDLESGIASKTGTKQSGEAIDTATVGTKTFTVDATDNAGNSATKTVKYYIRYNYGGILQPINADGSGIFKLGSTIPVKFQLKDASGNFITNAVAKIYVAKIGSGVAGTEIEATSTSAATVGNLFRYDSTSNQYIFNLGTKSLSAGIWQIRIELDDGTSKYTNISLK